MQIPTVCAVKLQNIEIIPSDDSRRTRCCSDAKTGDLRDSRGQQLFLDAPRFIKLVLAGDIRSTLGTSQNGAHPTHSSRMENGFVT